MFKSLAVFAFVAVATAVPVVERAACSPLELVWARGTSEEGLGIVGSPLARQIAALVPGATSYNVNYPSSAEYLTTPRVGANDAQKHIAAQAAACPDQKFAIGGYSKGAMVAHLTTLPANLKSKVVGVAVFGDPYRTTSTTFPVNSNSDVIKFCNLGDPVCQNGANFLAHIAYASNGDINKAATFIAERFN